MTYIAFHLDIKRYTKIKLTTSSIIVIFSWFTSINNKLEMRSKQIKSHNLANK